jgi:uncharacterized protein
MSDTNPLPKTPDGSSLERVVSSIGAVYARIETDQGSFLASAADSGAPLLCPPGCGSCCKPFIPDVLPVEAAYAAAWILEREPELALEIAEWKTRPAAPPCPLLRETSEGSRCAIYPARFLICRLFGSSGVRDKDGRAVFRPCAHMPVPGLRPGEGPNPVLTGEALACAFGSEPPVMADYAAQIVGLSPSEAGERRSVVEALPVALVRVGLCLSLASASQASPSLAARAFDATYSREDEREEPRTRPSPDRRGNG